MRFQLEVTPEELWTKGDALVTELVKAFSSVNPDLAEALEKSLPPKEQDLKYPALRGLKSVTTKAYESMLKRMLSEIGKVLDQSISGTSGGFVKALQREMGSAGGHTDHLIKQLGPPPKDKDEEEEPEEEEEKLEPGDYDPKTDTIVPEPEEEEEEEEEETEKALAPQSEPVKGDFTKPIADADSRAYERVKRVFMGRGYNESDFEEGGEFYGMSVNELIDLIRGEKAS